MFKDESGIKDGTDADNGTVTIGGGCMSESAASLSLFSLSLI